MKTLRIFSSALICTIISSSLIAQKTKTETFKVSGECGMCEKKIEKAAKTAGATYAEWNKDTKIITVKYNSTTSNLAKIQKSIADAGYDNAGTKASSEAYDKLDECCKYERTESNAAKTCCDSEKCSKEACAGMDCCKDKEGKDKDCCKKESDHH
jgi:mercuric ion binding protein